LWGGNAIAGKLAVGHISPMMLTMFRWGIALAIMVVVAWPHLKKDWPIIRENWLYLFLMGAFGYTAFNFCLYSALQYISAINVTLEQSAMPIIIFLLNFLLYRTRVRFLQIVGYLITVVGVVVTVSAGDPMSLLASGGRSVSIGDLFMLCAALFYGGYSVALRAKPKMHWQSFLTALIAAAFPAAIVGAAMEAYAGASQFPVTLQGLLVALYAGIFPSLLSQGFFIRGVEMLGANAAGLYINLVPIFGALLAVAILGEQLFFFHAVAFVLVVGGITLAQRAAKAPSA
ncbi:MAG: DMT family transporter, partial [Pseudomonadota bacterium]